MILIAHRGNTHGPKTEENSPDLVDKALSMGFEVELDVRIENGILFLGHDYPTYRIEEKWLLERSQKLWIHCKNIEAMDFFYGRDFNYFWHQEDDCTLTSKGLIWTFPGKKLTNRSIAVLPEKWTNSNSISCFGICSDFISSWKTN